MQVMRASLDDLGADVRAAGFLDANLVLGRDERFDPGERDEHRNRIVVELIEKIPSAFVDAMLTSFPANV